MKNAPHEKSGTQGKTVQCGKNLIGKIEHGKSEYWKYSQEQWIKAQKWTTNYLLNRPGQILRLLFKFA